MYPILFSIGGHPVYSFGTCLALGFFFSYYYVSWMGEKIGVADADVLNLFIILVVSGVAGSRLMAVALAPEHYPDLKSVLQVNNGGLAFHGGLLLALVTGIGYVLYRGLPLWPVLDRFGPAVPMAHSFGRVGCFLYGCCFGIESAVPWALRMPPPDAAGAWPHRHPTTFVLHRAIDRPHRAGLVMVGYGYGYPLIRFPLEFIRADNVVEPHFLGLSAGQLACVLMAVAAAATHVYLRRTPETPPAPRARNAA
ncbi:MAG: prolipoprotein diacylglyceryl transferase [Candidatus Wallbacteria bacterium]|nr:prolipoprotein diacylglyceryl transferase [Candidatus Wallbacteria bacterium]